jgi:plasmid stabilization system protein ParE
VHKKTLLLLLSFAILFDFSGCVSMNAQARRERAYRHYVAKQTKQRRKAMAQAQKAANRQLKMKLKAGSMEPSEPVSTTSLESSPGSWSEPMAPSGTEPVVAPMTVSASGSSPSQSESEPAQP